MNERPLRFSHELRGATTGRPRQRNRRPFREPLESISHTRKIRAVVLGGRYLDLVKMRDEMVREMR